MKKLALIPLFLAAGFSVSANATNTYVGMMMGIQNISTSTARFRGMRPGAFIGYGQMMSEDFYLAGELNASFSATISDNADAGAESTRSTFMTTLGILPGMMINNVSMTYLRIGGAYSRFSGASANLYGLVTGLGLETALTPDWSMRIEYDLTTFRGSSGLSTPRSDEAFMSMKYTFDV